MRRLAVFSRMDEPGISRPGLERRLLLPAFEWIAATEPTSPEVRARLIGWVIDSRLSLVVGSFSIVAAALLAAWRTGAMWPWVWLCLEIILVAWRMSILHSADGDPRQDKTLCQARMVATGLLWCIVFAAGSFMCMRSGITALAVLAAVNTVAAAGVSSTRIGALPRYGIAVVLICYVPFGIAMATAGRPGLLALSALVPIWIAGLIGLLMQNHRLIRRMIQAELQTRRVALTDRLTGVPNRLYLEEQLQAMCQGLARGERFCLLCLDLDGFKAVNDRHGHGAGDLLLHALAGRLRGAVREQDSVCRLGGDEFVVLLPGAAADEAVFIAKRIIASISRPFDVGMKELLQVGVSIGSAAAPEHGSTPEALLSAADQALYAAKGSGRGTHRSFIAAPANEMTSLSA